MTALWIGGGVLALVGSLLIRRRGKRLPLSERLVLILLHLAAWLEDVGTALDAMILRYRMERQKLAIEMSSTSEREGRGAAA